MSNIQRPSANATTKELAKIINQIRIALDAIKSSSAYSETVATLSTDAADIVNLINQYPVPLAPTNLVATGGFNKIILTWGGSAFDGYLETEIFRNEVDDLGTAVKVATAPAGMYVDTPPDSSLSQVYYYWVRFTNRNIPPVAGPFNAQAGTPASTADDPAYLLEVLSEEITESQLYQDLQDRIDLIDTPSTGLVASVASIQDSIDTINSTLSDIQNITAYDGGTTYYLDDMVTYGGLLYRAVQTTTGNLPTNTTYWEAIGEYSSLSEAVAAHAAAISDHGTRITDNETEISSHAYDLTALLADMTNAEGTITAHGSAISSLDTRVTSAEGTITSHSSSLTALNSDITDAEAGIIANASAVGSLDTRVTTAEGVITSQSSDIAILQSDLTTLEGDVIGQATAISSLDTRVTDNEGYITSQSSDMTYLNATVGDNTAAISSEAIARATADSAIAFDVDTLQVTVSGHTTSLQTKAEVTDLNAVREVKVDIDGRVTGYGLVGSAESTEMGFILDTLWIADPDSSAEDTLPFVFDNNVLYLLTARIKDLTATNFVGQKIVADELTAALASSYQQIIGWLLRSADNLVSLNMATKQLKMQDASGDYVIMTPGELEFYENGTLYKAVRRVVTGTVQSGQDFDFNPPFKENPWIMFAPSNQKFYASAYAASDQSLSYSAALMSGESDFKNGFRAEANLTQAGSGSILYNFGDIWLSSGNYTYQYTTQLNVTAATFEIYANGGGGIINVSYRIQGSGSAYTTGPTWQVYSNLYERTINFPSAQDWEIRFYFTRSAEYFDTDSSGYWVYGSARLNWRREYLGTQNVLDGTGIMKFIAIGN